MVIAISIFFYRTIRGQHSTIVDTSVTRSFIADCTYVRAAADNDIVEDDVLHDSAIDGAEQSTGQARDGVIASVQSASEGDIKPCAARDVGREPVVACRIRYLRQ